MKTSELITRLREKAQGYSFGERWLIWELCNKLEILVDGPPAGRLINVNKLVDNLQDQSAFCSGCPHYGEPGGCNLPGGPGCAAWNIAQEAAADIEIMRSLLDKRCDTCPHVEWARTENADLKQRLKELDEKENGNGTDDKAKLPRQRQG